MSAAITPCLWFNKNAEEAVRFYQTVFPYSEVVETTHSAVDTPSGREGDVLTVSFKLEGQAFLALNGGDRFRFTPAISLMVFCASRDEVKRYWDKLSREAKKVLMPLDEYDFSDYYGWIEDRYGLSWQIFLGAEQATQKIVPTLLFVDDNFGKAEHALKHYSEVFKNFQARLIVRNSVMKNKPQQGLAFASFTINGYTMAVMDGPGEHGFRFNESIAFIVDCENQEAIDYYWNALSAHPESEVCGWLKDKFGVSWQIVPSQLNRLINGADPLKAQRVMKNMMQMKKLIIKELEEA